MRDDIIISIPFNGYKALSKQPAPHTEAEYHGRIFHAILAAGLMVMILFFSPPFAELREGCDAETDKTSIIFCDFAFGSFTMLILFPTVVFLAAVVRRNIVPCIEATYAGTVPAVVIRQRAAFAFILICYALGMRIMYMGRPSQMSSPGIAVLATNATVDA